MHMMHALAPALEKDDAPGGVFLVSETCHQQTIDVVTTRAKPLGIEVRIVRHDAADRLQEASGACSACWCSTRRRTARCRTIASCARARTTRARWSRWRPICWR
jgi:glycine cleavage system pyridoxal-binding protein P